MAAGTLAIYFDDGSCLSVAITTTAAVGTSPACNWFTTAAAGDPSDFTVPRNMCIVDMISASNASGMMEVYNVSRGLRTGRLIQQNDTNCAVAVVNRQVPKICLRGGDTYRFIQTVIHA